MVLKKLGLQLNQVIDRNDLINNLVDFGYDRVSMVIEQGTFSVKGSIVDVFPVNQNQPIRCDFFGEGIDRLTSFKIDSQRSIRDIKSTIILSIESTHVKRLDYDTRILNSKIVSNIHDGDYVVHERYGIGKFAGFCRLNVADQEGEYVLVHFKGADKLYMPLDQLPLLHRYAGSDATPKLNGLYDGSWQNTRRKAHRALSLLAEDIYTIFKERQQIKGYSFMPDTDKQLLFEQAFSFQETPDQLTAICDIKRDMESTRPMDRLLCGDVGYGKTEVMVRAAVKAAFDLKQVMVLVPTTILAEQHFKTFTERCKSLDINIDVMSRLKSSKHNQMVIKKLRAHHVDIVIGTHRLLQKDIQFKDLGLVIVDEEQRFGVNHKEKIKHLSKNIDILSTSATPIPRTLYMSLTGAKAISTLNTPPLGRHPIHTVISEYSSKLIIDAIKRELSRGGQVYFLHNHVRELDTIRSQLLNWMPNIRVNIAHGQMSANDLEQAMLSFYKKECDVLCCTTIIENGLDIQNANTVIMNRADCLGLSQIHQIRGRVGRRDVQAYAYILFPEEEVLTDDSKQRLQAIKEAVGLGVGYQLAMKDLEIRGAGTLLGERQSGHLTSIGFDLYCKLLDQYIKKSKGQVVTDDQLISLENAPNVFIPASYIENDQQRLAMYQRLLKVKSKIQLMSIRLECEDRFGKLPKKMEGFLMAIERNVI